MPLLGSHRPGWIWFLLQTECLCPPNSCVKALPPVWWSLEVGPLGGGDAIRVDPPPVIDQCLGETPELPAPPPPEGTARRQQPRTRVRARASHESASATTRPDPTRPPASHLTHTSPRSPSPHRAPCSSPRLPSRKAEPRMVIIMSHLAKQQLTKTRERETGCSTALLGSPGLEVRATDMRSV